MRIAALMLVCSLALLFVLIPDAAAEYVSDTRCMDMRYTEGVGLKACASVAPDGKIVFMVKQANNAPFPTSGTIRIREGSQDISAPVVGEYAYNAGDTRVFVKVYGSDLALINARKNYYATTVNSEYYAGSIGLMHITPCIGNDYEQQMPVSGVILPSVEIANPFSSMAERDVKRISASASVDSSSGGTASYYWCADQGGFFQYPGNTLYDTVFFVGPDIAAGSSVSAAITLRSGDTLGYVATTSNTFTVSDTGSPNPSDPAPVAAINTPGALSAGTLHTIEFEVSDRNGAGEDSTYALSTDIYYLRDGIERTIARGLQGNVSRYPWPPQDVSTDYRLKLVTSDGNLTTTITSGVFAVESAYTIDGYVSDYNGSPLGNAAVQNSGGSSTYSDYSGYYQLTGLAAGSYTLSVSKIGYTFTPASSSVTLSSAAPGKQVDFQATVPCAYALSPGSRTHASGYEIGNVSVTGGDGCVWTAASNVDWLTIRSGNSGIGNGTVSYATQVNSTGSSRVGTLTIAGQTFTVTQSTEASCPIGSIAAGDTINGTLSSSGDCFSSRQNSAYADYYTFNGTAGQQLAISMSSAFDTYLYLEYPNGDIDPNDDISGSDTNSRVPVSGYLTLPMSGTYTIEATSAYAYTSGSYTLSLIPDCTYSISPLSRTQDADGGSSSVSVSASAGCDWNSVSNVAWISMISGNNGTGDGPVIYTVAENPNATPRSGTLTVAGQTFTVTQEGAGVLDCGSAITLTAGQSYPGSNSGYSATVNTYSAYPSWNESGPEVVHQITTTMPGDLNVTLSTNATLDVFILDACDPNASVGGGMIEATYVNAPAGTYYIVVDGYEGGIGSYSLTANVAAVASLEISGPAEVHQNTGAQYTSTAHYSNGSAADVTNSTSWSFSCPIYGEFLSNGYLTVFGIGGGDSCTITASYQGASASQTILLKDSDFYELSTSLVDVGFSDAQWGDYDNDGDLDLLISGQDDTGTYITNVYSKESGSVYTDIEADFSGVSGGGLAWGDYDNDGDLDILMAGFTAGDARIAKIYQNTGGTFADINAGLTGIAFGAVSWGDYDNDGDLDALIMGQDSAFHNSTKLYQNTDEVFTEVNAGLPGLSYSSADWGDYDNDGDLDLLLTGAPSVSPYRMAAVYENTGASFVDSHANLDAVYYGSAAWGDYDGDGDLDIILTGIDVSNMAVTKVYRNDDGVYMDIHAANLIGVKYSSVAWGDYDNDGDLDILLTGEDDASTDFTKVYENQGEDRFVSLPENLYGVQSGAAVWGDSDHNGELDIVLTGSSGSLKFATMYQNRTSSPNTVPSEPANLQALTTENAVTLSWDASSDTQTSQGGLTYNLRVGTTSGGSQILSAMADNSTGYRRIAHSGNVDHNTGWTIMNLPVGTYYWSVQAIDSAFAGSPFATEHSFTVYDVTSLSNDTPVTFSTIPKTFSFELKSYDWAGVAMNPSTDHDIDIGETADMNSSYEASASGGIIRDFVVSNGHSWGDALHYAKVSYETDSNYTIEAEWEAQDLSVGSPLPDSITTSQIIQMYEIWLTADQAYQLTLDMASDSTADLSMFIFEPSRASGGRSSYDWKADSSASGGDETLALTAESSGYYGIAVLNENAGSATYTLTIELPFTEMTAITEILAGVKHGSLAWGDYNNDGKLDILLSGESDSGYVSYVYRNNDDGTFTDINAGLTGVYGSSAAWGDFDNNGDLDLILTGYADSGPVTKIYRNNGNHTFTDIEAGLPGVLASSVAWGDYDNDGDQDVLLSGTTGTVSISDVYRNNGDESFTALNAGLVGVYGSSATWGDYNNDGDLDILLTGTQGGTNYFSEVYRNNGDETFTSVNAGLPQLLGASAWGDYDNDGDLDIVLAGWADAGSSRMTEVYQNNGDNTFSTITAGIPGIATSVSIPALAWGDYDNDGALDILLAGHDGTNDVTEVYRNDGNGVFSALGAGLPGKGGASLAWGDYDNDGDLDIVFGGYSDEEWMATVYRNNSQVSNTVPAAPGNLQASVANDTVTLSWNSAIDSQTPANGLTYNLRVGTTPGGTDIMAPMAVVGGMSDGLRKTVDMGNVNQNRTWTLRDLAPGTYYWSVQAIDAAFAGSAFSSEGSFEILPAYVLWTNVKKGKASLWKIDPRNGERTADGDIPFPIIPPTPWKATSFEFVDESTAYVLWSNREKGKGALWKINPQNGTRYADGAIPFPIVPPVPWTAESFCYLSETLGYVLWSNPEKGKGSLWKINPQDGTRYADGAIPFPIVPPVPWRATSFYYVDETTAYVLWTNVEKGKASLWKINPQDGTRYADGDVPFSIVPPVPWTAESFYYVSDTIGYVLWTNVEKGKAALWKINPQDGTRYDDGAIPFPIVPPVPWQATSFYYHAAAGAGGLAAIEASISASVAEATETGGNITLRKRGSGQGTIVINDLSCGPDCDELTVPYFAGQSRLVTTLVETDSVFRGWQTEQGVPLADIHYIQPGETVYGVFEQLE